MSGLPECEATAEAVDRLARAHASALARYEALSQVRSVAVTANAAMAAALAAAIRDPEAAGRLDEAMASAQRALDAAWRVWREVED